jgi:hypothetical protein
VVESSETALNPRGGGERASTPDPRRTMTIHMGIMCKMCRTVHFIAKSPSIKASKLPAAMYQLTGTRPCLSTAEFRKESMQSYRVSEDVFKRGYAKESEYEIVG